MEKGRIVFLNGVTSAGKTSIVEALQDRDDVFFYVVPMICFKRWWEISFYEKTIGSISVK